MKKSLLLVALMFTFGTTFAQWISEDRCFTFGEKVMPLCLNSDEQGTVTILSQPQNGTLTAVNNNKYSYQAKEGFVGDDSFQYQIVRNGITELKWYTVEVYEVPAPTGVASEVIPDPETDGSEFRINESGCPSIVVSNNGDVNDTVVNCHMPVTLLADVVATGLETNSYTFEQIPFQPPFGWTDGNSILVGIDDKWGPALNLPFGFCFYGNTYTQVCAGSNSCITFNVSEAGSYCDWSFSSTIPNSNFPIKNGVLACYRDIYPLTNYLGPNGGMYEDVMGEFPCRAYCVTWYNIALYSCNTVNNFITMIVLYEGTNIIDVYMKYTPTCTTWQNGAGVLGLINSTGTQAVSPPGRNTGPWVAQNEAWRFTPVGNPSYTVTWYSTADTAFANPLGTGDSLDVIVNSDTSFMARLTYTSCNGTNFDITDTINMYVLPNQISVDTAACDHVSIGDTTFNYSTVHTVVFNNDYGCDSIVTYNVSVFPAPTINSISGIENMAIASDFTSGKYNYSIEPVNNCDSTEWHLGGHTSWVLMPAVGHTDGDDAMYWRTVLCNSYGLDTLFITAYTSDCGPTYAYKVLSGSEVSVAEDLENNLSIRPNPTNGNIAIELSDMVGMYTVNVFTPNGSLVDSFVINAENNVYNYSMSDRANGVYYFSISNSEAKITRKVVLLR